MSGRHFYSLGPTVLRKRITRTSSLYLPLEAIVGADDAWAVTTLGTAQELRSKSLPKSTVRNGLCYGFAEVQVMHSL